MLRNLHFSLYCAESLRRSNCLLILFMNTQRTQLHNITFITCSKVILLNIMSLDIDIIYTNDIFWLRSKCHKMYLFYIFNVSKLALSWLNYSCKHGIYGNPKTNFFCYISVTKLKKSDQIKVF